MAKLNCGGCGRFELGRAYDITRDCRLCWLYHHDARYHEFYDGQPDVAVEQKTPECDSLGKLLTKDQRVSLGLINDNRQWSYCDHPEQPLGIAVCICRGCGPNCRGYFVTSVA